MNEHWHHASSDEVLEKLTTTADGLSQDEAAARLASHGPNRLPDPLKRGALIRFFLHFHNILIYVLLGSAFIPASLGHITDTLVILAAVIANAAIGFFQEGQSGDGDGAAPCHRLEIASNRNARTPSGLRREASGRVEKVNP